ncbi:hypothetical protein C8R44DRAFT_871845 [Mycena epipterygia]|nr:hypothetical protein C8R44DRAFT_871845 [Mycena epipterygia]
MTRAISLGIKSSLSLIFAASTWRTVIFDPPNSPIYPLVGFVNRSSCRLTRLVLETPECENTIVRLLGDLPSLEYLLVEGSTWQSPAMSYFFTAMSISGVSSDLCPSLMSLAFSRRTQIDPFECDVFPDIMAMAQSRLHLASPCRLSSLQFFSGSSNPLLQEDLTQGIHGLTDQGADVTFLYGDEMTALLAKDRP